MGRGLFVTDQNVFDPFAAEQGVVDRQHRPAGIAEHDLYAEIAQRLDEDIGSTFLGHRYSPTQLNACAPSTARSGPLIAALIRVNP